MHCRYKIFGGKALERIQNDNQAFFHSLEASLLSHTLELFLATVLLLINRLFIYNV